jgi:hypothetical protein
VGFALTAAMSLSRLAGVRVPLAMRLPFLVMRYCPFLMVTFNMQTLYNRGKHSFPIGKVG